MTLSKNNFFISLIIIQIVFIVFISLRTSENEQIVLLEKQIEELKFQNQQTRNLLLSLKANFNSDQLNLLTEIKNSDFNQLSATPELSKDQITSLIEENIDTILSVKLLEFRDEVLRNTSMPPPFQPGFNPAMLNPAVSTNKQYIDKQYDSITDDYFKSNLILADEIIDRAINIGEFTEWDAQELNAATQDLEFENKVFIMNKLSHAYNSQKIKGKFINYKLVNRNSEN